jgi:TonB family protein
MQIRITLAAVVLSLLNPGFGSAETAPSAPLHTFYGEVKAVDPTARTLTIGFGGKSFVFHVTDETKISASSRFVRFDNIKRGEGAAVVMRLDEKNRGIAVNVRIDPDPRLALFMSLLSAKTTRGETISGIAVNNLIAYQPPGYGFNRGIDFGKPRLGMFRVSVQPDGTVAHVTTTKSLGYEELDVRAAKWLQTWRFHPNSVTEARIPVVNSRAR